MLPVIGPPLVHLGHVPVGLVAFPFANQTV
jgi:hypothetical protein